MNSPETNSPDMVSHPAHYTVGGVEAIQVIKAKLTPEQYKGYLIGNILKYQMRLNYKSKMLEDAKKAAWYLQEFIEELETELKEKHD